MPVNKDLKLSLLTDWNPADFYNAPSKAIKPPGIVLEMSL
jgi:hypothetical protein